MLRKHICPPIYFCSISAFCYTPWEGTVLRFFLIYTKVYTVRPYCQCEQVRKKIASYCEKPNSIEICTSYQFKKKPQTKHNDPDVTGYTPCSFLSFGGSTVYEEHLWEQQLVTLEADHMSVHEERIAISHFSVTALLS